MEEESTLSPQALSLAGLSLEFCKILAAAETSDSQEFLRECVRYLPRIYIAISDLHPYGGDPDIVGEDYDTGAIGDSVTEEQYDLVSDGIARILGEYDMYLDAMTDDMQYSDQPVAISLSEQLADIFQCLANFAAILSVGDTEAVPDILADLKYRFHAYLSATICAALRIANTLYQSQVLARE